VLGVLNVGHMPVSCDFFYLDPVHPPSGRPVSPSIGIRVG
jgi:hypothetical protein